MVTLAVPAPISYDIGVDESIRIRRSMLKTAGMEWVLPVTAGLMVLQAIMKFSSAALYYRRPGHEGDAWLYMFLGVLSLLVAIAGFGVIAVRWKLLRFFIKPEIGTTVSFTNHGLEVVRGRTPAARKPRFVPFAKIRNVLFTPDALHLSGGFWTIAIPRRVLVDDGGPVLAFLTEHLVSKRLLVRSSSMSTMLTNTASR